MSDWHEVEDVTWRGLALESLTRDELIAACRSYATSARVANEQAARDRAALREACKPAYEQDQQPQKPRHWWWP